MKYIELDKAVLQILDVEVGHSVNKIFSDKEKFMAREKKEIQSQIEKTGKIDYSQWSTVCFDNLYNAVAQYREQEILPREDLIKVASNFVMKNTAITNESVARKYALQVHNEFVENVWKKLNEFKQSGEAIAMQTGKCYFEERIKEQNNEKLTVLLGLN